MREFNLEGQHWDFRSTGLDHLAQGVGFQRAEDTILVYSKLVNAKHWDGG
jgi:hypothetical protein